MKNLDGQDVLLGLSGGINSMAILCHMKELSVKPKSLHLFYSHFREHSADTARFVIEGIRFARNHFDNVFVRIERNSIIDLFRHKKMIPHPANSPCSLILKIERINKYAFEHGLRIDLVGYVKHELKKRAGRQQLVKQSDMFSLEKFYPIGAYTDEWCFEIVDRNIGWHPAIYDIKDEHGGRIFKHNNCLPCKNMYTKEIQDVKEHFPNEYNNAMKLSADLQKYWGRDKAEFYSTFGRDLGQESTCTSCEW